MDILCSQQVPQKAYSSEHFHAFAWLIILRCSCGKLHDQFFSPLNAIWESSFPAEWSLCLAKRQQNLCHHIPLGWGRMGHSKPQATEQPHQVGAVGGFIVGLVSPFSFTGFLQQSLGLN